MSNEGNGKLPALAVGRALLAAAPGRRKLDVIYGVSDPKAFVRRLPAEDLYFALREVGLADGVDVIGLLSPLQFRTLLDLDVWEKNEPSPARVLYWLKLAREGAESGASLRRQKEGLDRELILLVLRTQTRIHFLEENPDPVLEHNDWIQTPDNKYIVEITADEDESRTVRWLIEDFIDASPFESARMFEAVRWELKSELEETALQWRTGRMRDIGFPDLDEAMEIWRPLQGTWQPRKEAVPSGPIAGVPALLLAGRGRDLLLDRVTERLPDESRTAFNEGLLYLLNCSIVADGVAPRELNRARPAIEAARDMLSLGLELVSLGDENVALQILGATPPVELFRRAAGEVLELSKHAHKVARRLTAAGSSTLLLDSPDAEVVAGLRKRRPRLYDPPSEGESRPDGDWRAFRTRSDLHRAQVALARGEVVAELLERLNVPTQLDAIAEASGRAPTAVTLSQLMVTAAARALLRLSPTAEPLDSTQVEALCDSFEAGALTPSARKLVDDLFSSIADRLGAEARMHFDTLKNGWLERFESEVGGPCSAGGIDARFVETLLSKPPSEPMAT